MSSFARILIANRGEIALRIIRACRELGIETVAVCSSADRGALHVRMADRAVEIGPPPPAESYLNGARVIAAALETAADAIHPGYGFLAENAAFAAACEDAGLVFIGPPPGVIARLGSKIEARALMESAGLPVVPGETPGDQSDAGIATAVRRVGFPALIKASAGGGGKGMRLAEGAEGLDELIRAARREAVAAFGDGTLYVERRLARPRHVEIQIFADASGAAVHLFERECSVQRRHQKIVEESPSPAIGPERRARMGAAAVAAARAAGYRNAGTIEFLVPADGDDGDFYFLEMNTRLQVEHAVTESVTGVDLVRAQIAVAAGAPLPWTQDALSQRGHAIECRIYAEDPEHDFVPQAGRLLAYREPTGPGLRVDGGVREGDEAGVHYDPLLAKLVALAETREAAVDRMLAALRRYAVLGIRTNIPFLVRLIDHPGFRSGAIDTGFVDRHLEDLLAPPARDVARLAAAAAASCQAPPGRTSAPAARPAPPDPWSDLHGWRL
jgi:acetyl-CoA carboxylase biotin carboxylase subunit